MSSRPDSSEPAAARVPGTPAAGAGAADDHAACANCGAPFVPVRRRFCPECGQETGRRPPTLGEFVQQFGGAYFSTEGALWRSLKLLLSRPGALTAEYLAGRRKHYVLPLRLYLTISLVVLLLMRAVALWSVDSDGMIQVDLRKGEFSVISFGEGVGTGMKDGIFFCEGLPRWLCRRMQNRLDVDERGLQREVAELPQRFLSNLGFGMFLLLPLVAAALKLVYWNRGLHYTEHLVFALHLQAFWFLALLLTLPGSPFAQGAAMLAIPAYTLLAARRVYGGRWWVLLLRAALLATLYLVALVLLLAMVAIWSLLF